jgi:hypothetical protein
MGIFMFSLSARPPSWLMGITGGIPPAPAAAASSGAAIMIIITIYLLIQINKSSF